MVLSDRTIREEIAAGRIIVDPLGDGAIQPASVDVHLDRSFLVFRNSRKPYIDVRESTEDLTEKVEIRNDVPFILHPGEFVLASTLEHIEMIKRKYGGTLGSVLDYREKIKIKLN